MIDTRPEYTFQVAVKNEPSIPARCFKVHTVTEARSTARKIIKDEHGILVAEKCLLLYQFTTGMKKVLVARREDGKWLTVLGE